MTSTDAARSLAVEAQAIREESARWLRAADTRDADAVAMFYAEDGAFLVPNVPLARGRDAVRAVWAQLLDISTRADRRREKFLTPFRWSH